MSNHLHARKRKAYCVISCHAIALRNVYIAALYSALNPYMRLARTDQVCNRYHKIIKHYCRLQQAFARGRVRFDIHVQNQSERVNHYYRITLIDRLTALQRRDSAETVRSTERRSTTTCIPISGIEHSVGHWTQQPCPNGQVQFVCTPSIYTAHRQ